MNEDNTCLICLDGSKECDFILECCNKYIHGSCIKQWWELKDMTLYDAECPHCRQKAVLSKITKKKIKKNQIKPIINHADYESIKRLNIVSNIRYNLTDEDIEIINNNSNNIIPINNFSHFGDEELSDDSTSHECKYLIFLLLIFFVALIIIIIIISSIQ